MPTGKVQVKEFCEFVLCDYGPQIAEEFSHELAAPGSSALYSEAIKALDAVLARHAVASHSGPTTFRPDIKLVV